jgi:lysophospholipase L1-like esterase
MMPLGDSITEGGYNENGQWQIGPGYRGPLYDELTRAGFSVDFVGSVQSGPSTMPDRDHEGHSGWRIDQLTPEIAGWMTQSRPELILLMVGTNDIIQNYDRLHMIRRYSALLDQIRTSAPDAEVIAASIIPIHGLWYDPWARTFNRDLATLVGNKASLGMKIRFFDMYQASGITYADLGDGVHPTPAGYQKIADAWLAPVLEWLRNRP